MNPICFCQQPFTFPAVYVLFGCSCGEVWRRGIDRYGYTVWRTRIGVTAKAMQLQRENLVNPVEIRRN
jgi:hypothetical protein